MVLEMKHYKIIFESRYGYSKGKTFPIAYMFQDLGPNLLNNVCKLSDQ